MSNSELAMLGSQTWLNDSANDFTVSANVTGAATLTKSGTAPSFFPGPIPAAEARSSTLEPLVRVAGRRSAQAT